MQDHEINPFERMKANKFTGMFTRPDRLLKFSGVGVCGEYLYIELEGYAHDDGDDGEDISINQPTADKLIDAITDILERGDDSEPNTWSELDEVTKFNILKMAERCETTPATIIDAAVSFMIDKGVVREEVGKSKAAKREAEQLRNISLN